MKKQHILSICIAGALLTACGSGSSGGSTPTKPAKTKADVKKPTDSNSGHNVKNNAKNDAKNSSNGRSPNNSKELRKAVENALKLPVYWDPVSGDKNSATMGGKAYHNGDDINLTDFNLGLTKTTYSQSEDGHFTGKGRVKVYRQNYSAILAFFPTEGKLASNNEENTNTEEAVSISRPIGYVTKYMPNTGKATYTGKSFYQAEEGNLSLAVNFGEKTVSGAITGLNVGKVTLNKTRIGEGTYEPLGKNAKEEKAFGYSGIATLSNNGKFVVKMVTTTKNGVKSIIDKKFSSDKYHFNYTGGFFGPKAEETVGKIWAENKTDENDDYSFTDIIGFAGQRGKIKK